MNPQIDKPANLNLPPPVVESGNMPVPSEAAPAATPEVVPGFPEQSPPPAAMPQLPPMLQPAPPSQPAASDPAASNAAAADPAVPPAGADDTDLIEKEWVSKAKAIVEKTKEDPHQQTKDISDLKADYLKKRYNKTIKLSE